MEFSRLILKRLNWTNILQNFRTCKATSKLSSGETCPACIIIHLPEFPNLFTICSTFYCAETQTVFAILQETFYQILSFLASLPRGVLVALCRGCGKSYFNKSKNAVCFLSGLSVRALQGLDGHETLPV